MSEQKPEHKHNPATEHDPKTHEAPAPKVPVHTQDAPPDDGSEPKHGGGH